MLLSRMKPGRYRVDQDGRDYPPQDARLTTRQSHLSGDHLTTSVNQIQKGEGLGRNGHRRNGVQKEVVLMLDIVGAGYGIRTHDLQLGKLTLYR